MPDMETLFERLGCVADTGQRLIALLHGGAVRRYHTTSTVKDDTVAQHSWGVALFCYLIQGPEVTAALLLAALTHDLAEQVYGDTPAPTKRLLRRDDTVTQLERSLLEENGLLFSITEQEAKVLKWADYMDAMLRCIAERRLGNRNMERLYGPRLRKYVEGTGVAGNARAAEIVLELDKMWEESCGTQHAKV